MIHHGSSESCCTCCSRMRISDSWVSTLKADLSALQWIQLSLHHTEGLSLQRARERLAHKITVMIPNTCCLLWNKIWYDKIRWLCAYVDTIHRAGVIFILISYRLTLWIMSFCQCGAGEEPKAISVVLYLDLQDWKILNKVAKSFMPPLFAASALCFLSASFWFSGLPTGKESSVMNVQTHKT